MDIHAVFNELFAPLYKPLPDSGKYLERIGIEPVENPDSETLSALVLAHQRSVPFENLDIFDDRSDISLGIPELYGKIVLHRRGGYCFELNAAFMALLSSLGYDCHAVAVRLVFNSTEHMPLAHRATIITIGGVRYFADVGCGGMSPQSALLLDETAGQPSGTGVFLFERNAAGTVLNRLIDGKISPMMVFSETPCDAVDFIALNEFQSKSKYSTFTRMRICNLVTATGNITLSGNILKVHSSGVIAEEKTLVTESDFRSALKDYFGIDVNFPLRI